MPDIQNGNNSLAFYMYCKIIEDVFLGMADIFLKVQYDVILKMTKVLIVMLRNHLAKDQSEFQKTIVLKSLRKLFRNKLLLVLTIIYIKKTFTFRNVISQIFGWLFSLMFSERSEM